MPKTPNKNGKQAKEAAAAPKTEVKPVGATWWGKRWIAALESASRDYVSRLGSGRAFARAGRVHGLTIAPGCVSASVEDTDDEIYSVTLRVVPFDARTWNRVIAGMSHQALFAAQLLAGEMPREIDRVFRACDCSLFPARQHELETDCSCADWASPCKHVAATHYFLGDALDKDPFLLFELRGRSKEQVLRALGHLRVAGAKNTPSQDAVSDAPRDNARAAEQGVPLSALSADNFEQAVAPLPAMRFHFAAPAQPASVLQQLGEPPSWPMTESPAEIFRAVYERTSAYARELATRSHAEMPIKRPRTRRQRASNNNAKSTEFDKT